MKTKSELLAGGRALMTQFCVVNCLAEPEVQVYQELWGVSACAFYRAGKISIHPPSCASIGQGGQAWSYPGYFIDRTPYGVIQHELGHHVDRLMGEDKGLYFSEFSVRARHDSGEDKLTNYCPNDAEWFAEMFRLYVTNSDLLKYLKPVTHALIAKHWKPVIERPWREVLAGAPVRNLAQCVKRGRAAVQAAAVLL